MKNNTIISHPAPGVSKKIPKVDKYFPQEFLQKLYNEVDSIRDKVYIMYHAETGLRVSDVVGTEIVHIDLDKCRTLTYDHKKDEWRLIYFPRFLVGTIKQWIQHRKVTGIKDKRLFPFSGKTANRIIKKWCNLLEFKYAGWASSHWFRHTFIRLSRRAGRDIKAVQQNTGDTIKTLLEWYEALPEGEMRAQIDGKPLIAEGDNLNG